MIELHNADIKKAVFKDVMFFSIAEGGAMGEPGGVVFFAKSGEVYHFNYAFGDVDLRKVEKNFPVLAECKFGLFGLDSSVPDGWQYVSLGMGNHLIINSKVYDLFTEKIDVNEEPSVIYGKWYDVAKEILCEGVM